MSLLAIPFPAFDPVAIALGPLLIRWYALAYILGLVLGWRYIRRLCVHPPHPMSPEQVDDFLTWATVGVVLGGRLGYVLFYQPGHYLANPLEIFSVWKGGMAFHGGALGVIAALWLFARKHKLSFLKIGDLICAAVPIGLLLGRIANFINGELWGREAPEDLPWAMIFPTGGPVPRHPSQLYEAALEGAVLFLIMAVLWRNERLRQKPGFLAGAFLVGYGVTRSMAEFFRQPDSFLGFLAGGATMGQLLSVPMIMVGLALMVFAWRQAASKA
ncbi:MAG: prolipoprotein diacylglyceryl transferase [Alphaproteobacteria bacterium]|nr:prolipoprotein diacylglyceryl transferase [Alphaproteobacteria bacterium]